MAKIGSRLARRLRLGAALARKAPSLLRRPFPRAADRLLDPFRRPGDGPLPEAAYHDLVRHFACGWILRRTPDGAGARHPGWPSWSGEDVDALEGFARLMPLFGAWCASGRAPTLETPLGPLSLPGEFRRGLLAGTDPAGRAFWGAMPGTSNQRIVEAADVALALWLFRDSVWAGLSAAEQAQVADWLAQMEGRPGLDNNWQLFFVLTDRVLAALGHPGRISDARARWERIKGFHLGDGWFEDGPGGRVDYYSAWAFHYALSWIDRIDPDWDPDFIRDCRRRFLPTYRHLIGPKGFPILGRSVIYRMAAPAPLVAGSAEAPDLVPPAEARRALDCAWRHFIRRGAVRGGVPTQGYHGPDPRIVDPYSGPSSALWSLRSLVMAFASPPGDPFWAEIHAPLPVERADFDLPAAGGRWRVRGERATGAIVVEIPANPPGAAPPLEPFSRRDALNNHVRGLPRRPKSLAARYGRAEYRSDAPFCERPAR